MFIPPSIVIVSPVIKSCPHKNKTILEISFGVPTFPAGREALSSSPKFSISSTLIHPGAIQLTNTLGPSDIANACVKATIPPFALAYASLSGSD